MRKLIIALILLAVPLVSTAQMSVGAQTSTDNATTTPLAGAATYTGTGELNGASHFAVVVQTDVAGTLFVDFAIDGTNWTTFPVAGFDITGGVNEIHSGVKLARYIRMRIVNGAANQTYLRAQMYFADSPVTLNSPLNQAVGIDTDAEVVKAVSDELLIAGGLFNGYSIVNKFGYNGDVDAAEDIWTGGGDYTGHPTGSAELVEVLSAAMGDTGVEVHIFGLDANGALQDEVVTTDGTDGTTPVDSVNTYSRVFRAYVEGSTAPAGIITGRHTTTTANVFFQIPVGFNQSQVGAYTIPAGYTGYLRAKHVSLYGLTNNNIEGAVFIRLDGDTMYRGIRLFGANGGAAHTDTVYGGIALPALTDVKLRVTTASTTNLEVTGNFDIVLVED